MIGVMTPTNTTDSPRIPEPARGSRLGDVRIRRQRPDRRTVLGKIASRLLGVLHR